MKLKLTSKLLIPLASLVILGLVISITIAYISAKNGLGKAVTEQLVQVSASSESKVSQWLSRNKIAIDTWSRMDVVVNSLGDSDTGNFCAAASLRMKQYIDHTLAYEKIDNMSNAELEALNKILK